MALYYILKIFLLSKIKSGFLCHFPLLPFLILRFNCQTQEKIEDNLLGLLEEKEKVSKEINELMHNEKDGIS